jgi:hypothetical protein
MGRENRNEGVRDRDRASRKPDSSSDSNTGGPLWSSASGDAESTQAVEIYERLRTSETDWEERWAHQDPDASKQAF